MIEAAPASVGILAGCGCYPFLLYDRLRRSGCRVAVVGLEGYVREHDFAPLDYLGEVPLGALVRTAELFARREVRLVFWAGGVRRPVHLRRLRPDRHGFVLLLASVFRGDDALLRAVARRFAALGLEVGDPTAWLGDLLATRGLMAGPQVQPRVWDDARCGAQEIDRWGRRDRGQAVVVHRGAVVAREDARGTDALIAASPAPGAVLVKAGKPGQDLRFDRPAIGPSTVLLAAARRMAGVAVQSGTVLLLEKERLFDLCERHGVSLIGVD